MRSPRNLLPFALLLLVPGLARAEGDRTAKAVDEISRAVFEGAANRIQSFRSQSKSDLPARRGIEFHEGGVTITNVPRLDGNRFVEVRIPAAEPNSNHEVP